MKDEKIIRVVSYKDDEIIYLTSRGRILKYQKSMYIDMSGIIKEYFIDITPDLSNFKK